MAAAAKTTYTGSGIKAVFDEPVIKQNVRLPGGVTLPKGQVLGQITSLTQQNEVQTITITGTPTGGTFVLSFAGQVTAAIAYNAAAAAVQAALEALSTIGTGNVVCAGGALPGTAVTATFQGKCAAIDQPMMTSISSLTGGTNPAIAITETTKGQTGGMQFGAYNDGLSDGTNIAKAILEYACVTDTFGNITVGGGDYGETSKGAPAFFSGCFYTAELTGIDAAGVADLGRMIVGTTADLANAKSILRIG
jgi:hypothetical protein